MGWIALVGFWVAVGLLLVNLGWKPALSFVGLWFLGLFVFPLLGWHGLVFMSYQAALAVIAYLYLKIASVRI